MNRPLTAAILASMFVAVTMAAQQPAMRKTFLEKVAGPIANKMFECGMIP